ncbi:hypothetical protein [Methylobacterium nigriterrae]|uniref:hypothetical protein n=1 Tax=Methylobacterium nigriterrae TaxID=3127512 RepID=UPI0030137143
MPVHERRNHLTGRYQLRPDGDRVVQQLDRAIKPMSTSDQRLRNATPQDVMNLVDAQLEPTKILV